MKPFNLENLLAGEPAVTIDGRKILDHHYFKDTVRSDRLFCFIEGEGSPNSFYKNGKNLYNDDTRLDLFMEDKEVELWVNVYENLDGSYSLYAYRDLSDADKKIKIESFKGTHKITIKQ